MFQDLSPGYEEQCTNPSVTQQSSFESEDGFQNQAFRNFSTYGATEVSIPNQEYRLSSGVFGSDLNQRQIASGSHSLMMPVPQDSQHHDLPTVASRSDLQWLTTSSTDMRTQSPLNNSSPHSKMRSFYPSQPTPPNHSLLQPLDDIPSSNASITHHHLGQTTYPEASSSRNVPSNRTKKAASSSKPNKPKGTPGRKRKFQDHELTPEEAAKRRVRRERNKVAAAKCRNRRRELTDRLQGETDHLEDHQNFLQQEIMSLQQEKEQLEFILATHGPSCKAPLLTMDAASMSETPRIIDVNRMTNVSYTPSLPVVDEMMGETPPDSSIYFLSNPPASLSAPTMSASQNTSRRIEVKLETPVKAENPVELDSSSLSSTNLPTDLSNRSSTYSNSPKTARTNKLAMTLDNLPEVEESLNTPVCALATPSYTTGVFTYPITPTVCNTTTESIFSYPPSTAVSATSNALSSPRVPPHTFTRSNSSQQQCSLSALAQRRRSSSDSLTSPDSVNSHNLLAL